MSAASSPFADVVHSAPAVVHGGLDEAEVRSLGLDPAAIVDLSANINPLGASPRVREALASLDPSRYPHRRGEPLLSLLAERLGVRQESIVIGNGSTELIHLAARALLRPGDRAAILSPTFGEYERAVAVAGGSPVAVPSDLSVRPAIELLASELAAAEASLVFFCNPNNPTGRYLHAADVDTLLAAAAGAPLLIDEAYLAFVDEPWDSLPFIHKGRVLLIRSLTKDLGLAGLRLGYAVGEPGMVEALLHYQPSWSVSSAAIAAGVAALSDDVHLARSLAAVREGRRVLVEGLRRLGLPFEPPSANFVLVEVSDGAHVRRSLLQRGFCVRDCASFGLPAHIRIAVHEPSVGERLLRALEDVLEP